jgi:hypothetical protein
MLVGIFGNFGSGKTLLLTYLALKYASKKNYDVYANYHIERKRIQYLTPEKFIEINPPDSKRVFIALDEVYLWLDSRVSTSKVNRLLSWIILQSRKRNMDIGYTAQLSTTVDMRLRAMTDLIVIAENLSNGNFKYTFAWEKGVKTFKRVLVLPYWKAENIFSKYSTREIVEPINIEELKAIFKPKSRKVKNE